MYLYITQINKNDCMLYIVENVNPLYRILQSLQDQTATSVDDC